MKMIFQNSCILGFLLILLASCASWQGSDNRGQLQKSVEPLECIAVLPAISSVHSEKKVDYTKAKSLEKGASYASQVLQTELQGHPKVQILTSNDLSSFATEVSGGVSGTVAAISKQLNCRGVLLTSVSRFDQREGTDYSVESPAAVELLLSLRDGDSGRILWSGEFREMQESYLSNVLTFKKAQTRGFKWVTAEQLMEMGIKKRLAACPYLAYPETEK